MSSRPEGDNRLLLIYVHPAQHKSRVNVQMFRQAAQLPGITVHDLYERYPDFFIDVEYEQALLRAHETIVFQHPFYWYSCPALLKEWLDLVFEHGFAYGHEGAALHGKRLMSAVTTGGRAEAYTPQGHNHHTMRELLLPFAQTADLCGMHYLPPFVVHGTHAMDGNAIERAARHYAETLHLLCSESSYDEAMEEVRYMNDLLPKLQAGPTAST